MGMSFDTDCFTFDLQEKGDTTATGFLRAILP